MNNKEINSDILMKLPVNKIVRSSGIKFSSFKTKKGRVACKCIMIYSATSRFDTEVTINTKYFQSLDSLSEFVFSNCEASSISWFDFTKVEMYLAVVYENLFYS